MVSRSARTQSGPKALRLSLVLILVCLLAGAAPAEPPENSALTAESVIAILRNNPDLVGQAKDTAMRVLRDRGVAVDGMTDEGLYSEVRIDERVRVELSKQLRELGYVPRPKTEAQPTAAATTAPHAKTEAGTSAPQPEETAAATAPAPLPAPAAPSAARSPRRVRLGEDGLDRHLASASPGPFLRNFAEDQRDIWTSPSKARVNDLNWILPVAGVTGGLISTDAELSSRITNPTLLKNSSNASNAGVGVLLAGAGGLYLIGKANGDAHKKETGILALEAAANGLAFNESMKLFTERQRPTDGTGQGYFGSGGGLSSSFPSTHATVAWSVASVIAHEYPGTLTQILVYGLASGVSAARVTGRDHFPSDVVVGSVAGWLIGRQVYRAHHDPELAGADYGTFEPREGAGSGHARSVASAYVPMDSWVYPAFERLAALGAIPTGMLGMRPWTRMECARLLEESSSLADEGSQDEASRLYAVLEKEFTAEIERPSERFLQVDSIYARGTGIAGRPLTDGYHFGQTIVNDYGRPYQEGFNGVAGVSGSSSIGAMGFYFRGEFEHAPSAPGVPQSVQDAIQVADEKPLIPASPIASFNSFRLLDAYVMLNVNGWQASFGKETLWLGPTLDPFTASDNAAPVYMFRLDQTRPRKMPWVLGKILGPYRTQFWFGQLAGHEFVNPQTGAPVFVELGGLQRQPFINGAKITFKPTPNLEFGVGRTGLFGGPQFPVTLGTFKNSMFATTNAAGFGNDPGDRRSFFDFSYRIPGLRKWLMLYNESFVEDEISPLGYPRRAAQNQGLYMPQLPGLHKVDLRVEGGYTNLPGLFQPPGGGFFDWNTRYLDGYTNQGNILGNATLGRQGIAFRAQSTYWFAADKNIQVGYRNQEVDSMFLQGGNLRDTFVHSEWTFNKQLSLTSFLQYEWWDFPLLTGSNQRSDFTASLQLTYRPHWKLISSGK